MKLCGTCKSLKEFTEFSPDKRRKDGHYPQCKSCRKEYYRTHPLTKLQKERRKLTAKALVKKNPEKAKMGWTAARKKHKETAHPAVFLLYSLVGKSKENNWAPPDITVTDLIDFWPARENGCQSCFNVSPKRIELDHCHTTGLVRGWLCQPCNTAIGTIEGQRYQNCKDFLKKVQPDKYGDLVI